MDVRSRISARGKKVLGVGSALTDILVRASDEELQTISHIKGGMTLVDSDFLDGCMKKIPQAGETVPGGAACNTIQGLARLGGEAVFMGKRGNDATGDAFESFLKNSGVHPVLSVSRTPSGRVLSIITPDAQRSMFTFLGASSELAPSDIVREHFETAAIVFMEGYLFFNPDLAFAVLEEAQSSGAVVAMDLASFTVVEAASDLLHDAVPRFVDILIANEDEAYAYTGYRDPLKALEYMASEAGLAVLKMGKDGSLIRSGETLWQIAACNGNSVKDTTGAGDLWAAGFLHGLVLDWPMENCGALASACGYEVCCVVGAQIPEAGWLRICSRFLLTGARVSPVGS
ncbi:adenosine kinase [Desulfobotulus sp. H1]|uniref:Adenosine kinase n=1 Tax=Desulfobotulus pelophilus TaxID=2823377 RepID=A0ABT3NB91_9BACT|nr:adenosine kinase [Desulfobotulus pelophilus]MCW7754739.1 adenosine kinase [Desulfobotulus pelophilus]